MVDTRKKGKKTKTPRKIEKGRRFKECRELMGLTQMELAGEIPSDHRYISQIESGWAEASTDFVRRSAEVLKVRFEYLLCEDNFRTDADLRKARTGEKLNRIRISDTLENIGIYAGYFSLALCKRPGASPDRFLLTVAPHSDTAAQPGDYVCTADDYNYFASSVVNMIAAQTKFFLDTRCHKMTEQEYAEKKELDLKVIKEPGSYISNAKLIKALKDTDSMGLVDKVGEYLP